MKESGHQDSAASLLTRLLALGPHIRYAARGDGTRVEMRERAGLDLKSSSETDFFEEVFVNPTILGLAGRRGELDCGGLRHVIVGYGLFNQVIIATPNSGHVSVAVELTADADVVAKQISAIIDDC